MGLLLCSQGRPTGQRTTSLRQLAWAWWWTRPALRLKKAKRLCRAKQRSSSSETGRLSMPALSLLTVWTSAREAHTEGLSLNKAHCIVNEHLACSFHLNFILLMQNPLAVLCEWTQFVSLLFPGWLPVLYIIAFLYFISKRVIFILCVVLTNVLHELRYKGTRFVQFILCLEHFVYFPGAEL